MDEGVVLFGIKLNKFLIKLIIIVCFFSLLFNLINFGLNSMLTNANASLVRYMESYNCGVFDENYVKDIDWSIEDIDWNKILGDGENT